MLDRVALVLALAIAVCLVALLVRTIARRRIAVARGSTLPSALHARLPARGSGIVYFYGPHCSTCRQQALVLDRLSHDEDIAVVHVDAAREAALADALAVMTVPTTVIVDRARTVRAVNAGFRSGDALAAQLRNLTGIAVAG